MLRLDDWINDEIYERPLLFYFDIESSLVLKTRARAYSFLYDTSGKSFYLHLDFGLKHFLRVPFSNFFDMFLKNFYYVSDDQYLYFRSLGALLYRYNYFYAEFNSLDYFNMFRLNDWTIEYCSSLYLSFFNCYFFRKLGLFKLDFFVSSNLIDYGSGDLFNLVNESFTFNYVFVKSYWDSWNNYGRTQSFLNFLRIHDEALDDIFYNNYYKKYFVSKKDWKILDEDLKIFLSDELIDYLSSYSYTKVFGLRSNAFLRPHEFKMLNLVKYLLKIFNIVGGCVYGIFQSIIIGSDYSLSQIIVIASFRKYKICLFLYEFALFGGNSRVHDAFDFYRLTVSYVHEMRHPVKYEAETLGAYLARKYAVRGHLRKNLPQTADMYFGYNNFFKVRDVHKDWYLMRTYHERQFNFKIADFVKSIGVRFFFFFRKNYLNFFFFKSNDMSYEELVYNLLIEFQAIFGYMWFLKKYNVHNNAFGISKHSKRDLARLYFQLFPKKGSKGSLNEKFNLKKGFKSSFKTFNRIKKGS